MDFTDVETKTGVRAPFQHLPASKNVALKFHIPTGLFYSPFASVSNPYEASPLRCTKCMASIHLYANKNKAQRKWGCSFCGT
jgi:protein transport protein SEC23